MGAKVKVCFIGLGSIGRRHVKNLARVAAERGVEVEIDAFRHAPSTLPADVATLVRRQILDASDVRGYDWIFVCNPSQNHYHTLLDMKDSASWFFVEKPVFSSPLGPDELGAFGDPSRYYVACPLRYTSTYRRLREYVAGHRILSVGAICSSYLPEWRPGVDYRTLYSARRESGGVKLDLIHEFDYLIDLFGFPEKSVLVEGKVSDLEIESSDMVSFIGRYPDKVVELHLDYFGREKRRRATVWTPDETAEFDFLADGEDANAPYLMEMAGFFDIALCGAANINNLQHANEVLEIISKGNRDGMS